MRLEAFAGMLDDAAVFPPGDAPLDAALPAHRAFAAAWYRDLTGPFVFPAGRLGELSEALNVDADPVTLSITAAGQDGFAAALRTADLPGARLAAIELVPDQDAPLPEPPEGVRVFAEIPRGPAGPPLLDALAGTGRWAKFRTGGLVPQAHPTETELAASILAATSRGVPFKCTAGLHHAVRHTDGDLEQHGFLNVLLATAAALDGGGEQDLAALLAIRDRDQVAGLVADLAEAGVARARERFVSFGTCSITDPVSDLVALGLIDGAAVRA